jgi:hypothetical protein
VILWPGIPEPSRDTADVVICRVCRLYGIRLQLAQNNFSRVRSERTRLKDHAIESVGHLDGDGVGEATEIAVHIVDLQGHVVGPGFQLIDGVTGD